MPNRNINNNPIQSHYDDLLSGVKKSEHDGSFPGVGGKSDIDGVRNAEASPSKDWKNNVVGKALTKTGGPMSFIKTKSPMLAIIIALVGGGFGMIGLSSSALLPMSIVSNLVQKFNTQETSLTIRTNKLLASKMASDSTSGMCNLVQIACRFTIPSNRFLGQLNENGIKAFNGKGEIDSGGIWPNARPDVYQFTDQAGETTYVQASELKQTLIDNPEFRDAFHEASKTRFESLSDSVFDFIKEKFGFSTSDQLASTTDAAGVEAEATSASSLGDSSVATAAGEGSAAVSTGDAAAESAALEEVLQPEEQAVTEEVVAAGEGGGGNAVGIVGAIVCTAADVPGMITKAARDFQMLQLIKYSAIFLSAFGAIKAGDAKPDEVSAIGKVLTETVGGKSAMDSFGMRNVMNGDVIPQNNNFKTFSPGALVMSKMGGVASIANNDAKKNACAVAVNPATGQAINVALVANSAETAGAALGAAVVNVVAGVALAKVAETILPWALSNIIKLIPVDKIMGFFMGDLTKGLTGEAVGDALTSGASHTMGQTASSGGNVPLSVTDAVAYNEETKKVQLAYAEEDRATKSPFDITSPNTMLGSIVQKLLPYYVSSSTSLGSISSGLATISKIVTGSFSTILQPYTANAASPEQQYQLCDDPTIKDNNIAAGPFCNIIYGVPTKYLDKDPVAIVESLVTGGGGKYAGNVDKDTGEPVAGSDLDKWIKACTDGKTDQAKNCEIADNDDKTASFALYTIDHRIQKSMDDTPSDSSSSSSSSSTPSTGDAQQLAKEILANKQIDLSGRLVKKDIQAAADDKIGTAGVMTSSAILKFIATLGKDHKVSVSAIQSGGTGHCNNTSKSSCPNDRHYTGDAVDFNYLDGSHLSGRDSGSITIINMAKDILPTVTGIGQKQCSGSKITLPKGWSTFDDTCDHLHIQVAKGTP